MDPVEKALQASPDLLELLPAMISRGHLLHATLAGSRAYGLDTPLSDVDVRGFFIAPTSLFLGLQTPPEQYAKDEPDIVLYELGKFARLAAACNPAAIEVLFSDDVLFSDPKAKPLLENRHLFLSQQARERYLGYATSQLVRMEKLIGGADATDRFHEKTRAKHIRHLFRLLEQGQQLLSTGQPVVKVSDPAGLFAKAELPLVEIKSLFEKEVAKMKEIKSPLPLRPDLDAISELVVSMRMESM